VLGGVEAKAKAKAKVIAWAGSTKLLFVFDIENRA